MRPVALGMLALVVYLWWKQTAPGVLLGAGVVLASWLLLRPQPPGKRRRLSFLTKTIARGPFPPSTNAIDYPIHAALFFDQPPATEELISLVDRVLVQRYALFRSVPVSLDASGKTWEWEELTPMSTRDHLIEKEVSSSKELHAYLESLIPVALPQSRPMWEMHLIRNRNGRSCLVVRVSHALGDGLALVTTVLGLMTDGKNAPMTVPEFKRRDGGKARVSVLQRIFGVMGLVVAVLRALVKVLTMPMGSRDSATPLLPAGYKYTGPGKPRLVQFAPIPLARVKAAKERTGATVNDIVVSAFAGAIHRYSPEATRARVFVPYAFPGHRKEILCNNFSFISLPLSVAGDDALQRLVATTAICERMKSSPEAHVQLVVNRIAGVVLPTAALQKTNFQIMTGHTSIFTNVPGPQESIYLAGAQVVDIMAFLGNVVSQTTFVSYMGTIIGTFVVDTNVVSDPERFVRCFDDELAAICG